MFGFHLSSFWLEEEDFLSFPFTYSIFLDLSQEEMQHDANVQHAELYDEKPK